MHRTNNTAPAFGRLAPDWRNVYPKEELRNVVVFFQDKWQQVVARRPSDFHLGKHESRLTKFFNAVLEHLKNEGGFIGHFVSEGVHGNPDMDSGNLLDERRTDIRYLSARSDLTLTFEFKKLKDNRSSRLKYYGTDGIRRFVDGHYAKDNLLGIMVGLVGIDAAEAIDGIERVLAVSAIQSELHMLSSSAHKYVRNPSDVLPSVARFDTEHSRAASIGKSKILLCHLFFDTPTPKPK